MKYAVEVIGYGKTRRYALKSVSNGLVCPVDGKSYKTKEGALKAAEQLSITVEVIGDLWEIID